MPSESEPDNENLWYHSVARVNSLIYLGYWRRVKKIEETTIPIGEDPNVAVDKIIDIIRKRDPPMAPWDEPLPDFDNEIFKLNKPDK